MISRGKILIVENDRLQAEMIARELRRSAYECIVADSGEQAVKMLDHTTFNLVITNYQLGGTVDGITIIHHAKNQWYAPEVILMTAHGDDKLARNVLKKENAYDYMTKPIDLDELKTTVDNAIKQSVESQQNKLLRKKLEEKFVSEDIISTSTQMERILKIVRQVALTNISILLQGESGTGKDLIAQAIHQNSPRSDKRIVTLDCAGLSEGVLESELFGHSKGAFTGAVASRKGRFEYADGSTLFLDEIGEMPLSMQTKLLRVLENREIIPVGSNEPVSIDVRLISATNRDLAKLVKEGGFRKDLYFRIKGVTLKIPPLRERRDDIPLLIRYFLIKFAKDNNQRVKEITPEASNMLVNYYWPGNVRELKNCIESMAVLSEDDVLDVEDVPEDIQSQSSETQTTAIVPLTSLVGKSLQELEKEHIINTLEMTDGNREKAANILGIAPRTLYRKLKEYGLTDK